MTKYPLFISNTCWVGKKVDGTNMRKLNLSFFYELGGHLDALANLETSNATTVDTFVNAVNLTKMLPNLFDAYPDQLKVSKAEYSKLKKQLDICVNWNIKNKEDQDKEPSPSFSGLKYAAEQFQILLVAELGTFGAFSINQKGIYNTTDLVEKAENTLPESIRRKLSANVTIEIREGGKCLAFDTPTASGFHMLRATESVLHLYYIEVCKPPTTDSLDNWGAYIATLNKSTDAEVKKVVAMLQQIKDLDRNLIMHPEVILDSEQAFTLFETLKAVIIEMASKLPNPVI
jgi:hypothetical protein